MSTAANITKKETPSGFKTISEGKATILFPEENEVFYNPVQNVNRDLSVLVLDSFAQQLQDEALDATSKRKAGTPWRRKQATKEHWGRTTDPAKDNDAPVKEIKDDGQTDPPKGLYILEALSATGLRSIRYANEVKSGVGIDRILVNDLEAEAVTNIKRNVEHNNIDSTTRCVPNQGDAAMVMYSHRAQASAKPKGKDEEINYDTVPFHVVDLDPYGSPVPFLDSAVQCVADGGLMQVTATDLAVLAGGNASVCFSKYGSMPVKKGKYHHEMALRMLLSCIETHANRYNRYVVPLVSLRIDFYVRIFLRIYTSKEEIKRASLRKAYVIQSKGCDSFHIQPLAEDMKSKVIPGRGPKVGEKCPETGYDWSIGGPIWSDPIHNKEFVKHLLKRLNDNSDLLIGNLKYANRVKGLLLGVKDELPDVPLYYSLPAICSTAHIQCPGALKIHAALENAGYRVSQTHDNAEALKTDAPPNVIWDILRCYARKEQPIAPAMMDKIKMRDPVAYKILSKEPELDANFDISNELRLRTNKRKAEGVKYPENPEENWGPKAAARGKHKLQTHRRGGKKQKVDQKKN